MPNVTIDLTQIIVAIIGLMAAFITYRLVPWIKANTTAEQQAMLGVAVKTAVFAAEQLFGAGHGTEKFDYVVNQLEKQGYTVSKDDIEAAVYELLNQPNKDVNKVGYSITTD